MQDFNKILNITKNLNLLYVEDDDLVQKSSIEMLSNFFNTIVVANNGQEALEKYEQGEYDLLITDLAMPKMNGIELIKHIREYNRTIPIIVFSAWTDSSYISECIALNIDAYLLKPLSIENLINALYKVSLKLQDNREVFKQKFDIDALTQLKSHNALLEEIQNTLDKKIPVMMLINIDEFHIYNELYGLDVGDKILLKFAQQLEDFNSTYPYKLYRMSGDEFILFEKADVLDTDKYTDSLEALFTYIDKNPILIEGIEETISLNITVGISFHYDNLYGRAEMALNEARKCGRNYLGFSSDADRREELKRNLYWREEINRALKERRVHTFYHSIVDKNENILKYEALIRIKQIQEDRSVKIISPNNFLDFSKVSKQYVALTKVVIEESFATMLKHNVHVAINITFHDIQNREINRLLHEKISDHHLASKTKFDISSKVIFELLEHSNTDDYALFTEFLNEFKALGVLITIDNFGLGFANMSKISAMAPNYVKIDSTLIKNIITDKHAYALVKAIVKFAQELGIKTIAEHVASKEIFEATKEIGIDEFQGYYFGKPVETI